MAGTKAGAALAKKTLLERDPDYFKTIGRKGGSAPSAPKGFAWMLRNGQREKIQAAGHKGGSHSPKDKQ